MSDRKPTRRQKEIVNHIIKEVRQWGTTNDLSSPTHQDDIGVFLVNLDLTENDRNYLQFILNELLEFVRDKK